MELIVSVLKMFLNSYEEYIMKSLNFEIMDPRVKIPLMWESICVYDMELDFLKAACSLLTVVGTNLPHKDPNETVGSLELVYSILTTEHYLIENPKQCDEWIETFGEFKSLTDQLLKDYGDDMVIALLFDRFNLTPPIMNFIPMELLFCRTKDEVIKYMEKIKDFIENNRKVLDDIQGL